jgi:hypothetical protein
MKDRSGPGIIAVSTAGDGAGAAAPSAGEETAAWIALPGKAEEPAHRHKKPVTKMANERRRDFIIGHLLSIFELLGLRETGGEMARVLKVRV